MHGKRIFIAVAAFGLSSVAVPSAHGFLSKSHFECQLSIAKAAAKFLSAEVGIRHACLDANLAAPASCPAPDPAKLERARTKLERALAAHCAFDGSAPENLARMGFPGACPDVDPSDGFTLADLAACITGSHEDRVTGICVGGTNLGGSCGVVADCPDTGPGTICRGLLTIQYDNDGVGPLQSTAVACQKQVVKTTDKLLFTILRSVQRCRLDLVSCRFVESPSGEDLVVCKLSGFPPASCGTGDPRAAKAIAKSLQQLADALHAHCTDADAVAIGMCEPDQPTVDAGIACLRASVFDLTDDGELRPPFDLIDYEFPRTAHVCGDGITDPPAEECDGADDGACPGVCGVVGGPFPCICQNRPRELVIEHAGGDRDDVFGQDGATTEGSGYLVDLRDCDGPGGPATVCTVGPSCSLAPHAPCSPAAQPPAAADSGDEICATLGQGMCRTTHAGSTGPHCAADIEQRCTTSLDCATPGDTCLTRPYGPPVPIASGGVSVCVVHAFAEDVVGTVDLATGAGDVRLRERARVYSGGDLAEPCPVCGGFCSGSSGRDSPGERNLCTGDGDCAAGAHCVTDAMCSYGPNVDQPCRQGPPFGGPTEFFGTPSADCPPGNNVLGTALDVLETPRTTGLVSLPPSHACSAAAFANDACVGGANEGRPCVLDAECPGGTCEPQCFCAGQVRPNPCGAACVGGADDGSPCSSDADCSGGFCHPGDCRRDPLDHDSIQEGHCATDPSTQCFVNAGIERAGTPGVVDRVTATVGCMPGTGMAIIAALPGPFAITQPETRVVLGF